MTVPGQYSPPEPRRFHDEIDNIPVCDERGMRVRCTAGEIQRRPHHLWAPPTTALEESTFEENGPLDQICIVESVGVYVPNPTGDKAFACPSAKAKMELPQRADTAQEIEQQVMRKHIVRDQHLLRPCLRGAVETAPAFYSLAAF